jgi:hypothetical protein
MLIMGVAMLIAGSGLAPEVAQAQQPGSKRTDLQRHDLSVPGREVATGAELATYVVEKGKPLITLVKEQQGSDQ